MILIGVLLILLMLNIDFSAVNLALQVMSKEFGLDIATIQWVMSSYLLVWSAVVITTGRLADLYGHRRLLLLGISVFSSAAMISGMAPTIAWLITGRALQGLGGALFMPSLYAIINNHLNANKQGIAIGLMGVGAGLGLAVGPILGGGIIHLMSWRWIFFINVPLALLVLFIFATILGQEARSQHPKQFDYMGVVLSASAMFGFTFALIKGLEWGFTTPWIIACFVFSFCMTIVLIYQQRRVAQPLIPLALLTNKDFLFCCLMAVFFNYIFATVMFSMALYLQHSLYYSPFKSGLVFLAFTLMFALMSALGGKLVNLFPRRHIVLITLTTLISGLYGASFLKLDATMLQVCCTLGVLGFALGLMFPILITLMIGTLNSTELSVGSGIFSMMRLIGDTLAFVLNAMMLMLLGRHYLLHKISLEHLNFTHIQRDNLLSLIGSTHDNDHLLTYFATFQHKILLNYLHQAFIYAISHVMLIAMGLAVFALLCSCRLCHHKAVIIKGST